MSKISGTIIKKDDIINLKCFNLINLNQNFVFIPYKLNSTATYTDLKPNCEYIELTLDSKSQKDTYFAYNVNNSSHSSFSFFEQKRFSDIFDKLDIYLMKLGAIKSDKKHIIEDLGILKLNDENIILNIKLKKIKKYV